MVSELVLGGGIAVVVFGFLAFQNRIVSFLHGARSSERDHLLIEE